MNKHEKIEQELWAHLYGGGENGQILQSKINQKPQPQIEWQPKKYSYVISAQHLNDFLSRTKDEDFATIGGVIKKAKAEGFDYKAFIRLLKLWISKRNEEGVESFVIGDWRYKYLITGVLNEYCHVLWEKGQSRFRLYEFYNQKTFKGAITRLSGSRLRSIWDRY